MVTGFSIIIIFKRGGWWRGSSVVHLPSKCKALSSNPSSAKNKQTIHRYTGEGGKESYPSLHSQPQAE
jgi:hypothetical protein